MKSIEYSERPCDVCGGRDLHEIFHYTTRAKTRSEVFEWHVRNVVCRACGFSFVSPVPTQQSLASYYSDVYEHWQGGVIEFSIASRVRLVNRYLPSGQRPLFVEIGPNATVDFRDAVAHLVDYRSTELNEACQGDFPSLESIPAGTVDVLAAYFVLEHIPTPVAFLTSCAHALKSDGVLILEVPDLDVYAENPAGIMLYEHTNHFSPRSLEAVAAKANLTQLEASREDCSRPYGFVAVFRKSEPRVAPRLSEYHHAVEMMTAGAAAFDRQNKHLAEVRKRISAAAETGPVVLWPANKYCVDLLDGFPLPANAIVVDRDPAKIDYLAPVQVQRPEAVRNVISKARFFVITSSLHAPAILRDIENIVGRALSADEFVVVETGFGFYRGGSEPAARS
jgi:SAM-dependent methyltransferase